MNKKEFVEELKKININISDEQLIKLEEYYKLLIEWNNKINLTRITNEDEVYLKHFYDSLTLSKYVDLNESIEICDVGSGAGFPGIVLKILYPNLKITLIDSLNKRIIFLNEVIKKLELKNIEALHERMEIYSKKNKGKFDIITSRAVAKLEKLIPMSVDSLKQGGIMAFLKANIDEELETSRNIIKSKNCTIKSINKFQLPIEKSNRTIIIIEKIQ